MWEGLGISQSSGSPRNWRICRDDEGIMDATGTISATAIASAASMRAVGPDLGPRSMFSLRATTLLLNIPDLDYDNHT